MARKPLDPDAALAANQTGVAPLSPEQAYAARTSDLSSPEGIARAGFTSFGTRQPSGFPAPAAAAPATATRPAGNNVLIDTSTGRPAFSGVSDQFVRTAALRTPGTPAAAPVASVPPTITGPAPALPAPTTRGPLDVLSGIPASTPFEADLSGMVRPSTLDPAVLRGTPPPPPSGAEVAGGNVRSAIGNVVDPAIAGVGKAELGAYDATTGFLDRNVAAPVAAAGRAVAGFGRGLLGRKTAAGVSNASAAQFEQPTKGSSVPKTPTAPVSNIDRSPNSIGRFGLSDAEFNRRKFAFSGF